MAGGLSYLHVAAGSAVVVIASSWPALIGPGTVCRTLDGLTGPGCVAQGRPYRHSAVGVRNRGGAGVAGADCRGGPGCVADRRRARRPDNAGRMDEARHDLGLRGGAGAPRRPVRGAAGDASSLGGGRNRALPGSNAAPTLEVAFLVSIAVAGLAWRSRVRYLPEALGAVVGLGLLATHLWPGLGLCVAVLGGVGVAALVHRGRSKGHQPLRRTAPGVLLGVSLLVALGFSAVALLGAGYVLNRGASASNLLRCDPAGPAAGLCAPRVYVWGGTSALVAGVLTGLLVAMLLVLAFVRAVPGEAAVPVVQRSRRWAALALAAVLVMLLVAVRSLGSSSTRPLGLVWDLLCFLPRAVHPFAPPCYAERAVPELADRTRTLVRAGRLVVLSAHSLGAVLAVAAFFRLDGEDRRGVRLLTYGAQLRPYFGRLFPDLFGPQVLGSQPCPGARLWTADPWADDRQPAAPVPEATTLLGELGTGWLSLWRRTDPLGSPTPAPSARRCAVGISAPRA